MRCDAQCFFQHASSVHLSNQAPGLVCADIDSAFRRVPLNPMHQWASGVAYLHEGTTTVIDLQR